MKRNLFLETMSSYLVKYGPITKGLSKNTLRSYSSTFQLLFMYLKIEKETSPYNITFEMFNKEMLEDFFIWLEEKRNCSISTRNQRLRGLSAFAGYSINQYPVDAASFYNAISYIPAKKAAKAVPVYFTKEEIGIILRIPSGNGKIAKRNRTIMSILYASGARAQELCDIRVGDVRFGEKTSIKLIGKGSKARIVTVPLQCSALLEDYLISINKLTSPEKYVFSSQTHEHMTISCVEEVVKKYVRQAKEEYANLFREKNYTPHSFRHSIAVHMLEAGVPLPVKKNFLGHSSIEVTMIYATVSDELKNKYLRENSVTSNYSSQNKKVNKDVDHYPGLEFINTL